ATTARAAPVPEFAVAAYGSPVLHGSGQWSVVRVRNAGANPEAVEPVDSPLGVPLVREGGAGVPGSSSGKPYRWADPAHLVEPSPSADYAFLSASDPQRILSPRPKVEDAAATVTSVVAPRLADPYALLKAGGLFPRPADAIGIVTPWALTAASG